MKDHLIIIKTNERLNCNLNNNIKLGKLNMEGPTNLKTEINN